MLGITWHRTFAFLYGFVGSVVWLVPILYLFAVSVDPLFVLLITLPFTIFWYALWTWYGSKHDFYVSALIPYSIGAGLGIVVVLYYAAFFNSLFAGAF